MSDQIQTDSAAVRAAFAAGLKALDKLDADYLLQIATPTPPVPVFPASWCGHAWVNFTR